MSRWLYMTSGIALSLLLLFFANVVNFNYQEDVRKTNYVIDEIEESFQYSTDAWVIINSIKTETKDERTQVMCDKALECIGRSKDAMNLAKDNIHRR